MPRYGSPDQERDGLREVTFTADDDARLEGWVQTDRFFIPPDETAEVDHIETWETGDLFDRIERLVAFVAIESPREERSVFPMPIFFRRLDDDSLRSLDDLQRSLRLTLQTDDLSAFFNSLKTSAEPWPTGLIEPPEMDMAFRSVVAIEGFILELADINPSLASRAAVFFDHAYTAGRSAATLEVKQRYEAAAIRGLDVPRQKRAGGKARGAQQKAEADAWHQPAARWVQSLIDAHPSGARPLSRWRLAVMICDQWPARGFSEGSDEPPSVEYLAKSLLPKWEREGMMTRASGA